MCQHVIAGTKKQAAMSKKRKNEEDADSDDSEDDDDNNEIRFSFYTTNWYDVICNLSFIFAYSCSYI